MIASITGRITKKAEEYILLEQGGVGFQIEMAPGLIASLPSVGQTVTIHTHLHVRENEMGLFGFSNEEEKNLFILVQTVSGVGPKLALQVVGTLTPEAFALAILQSDVDRLTRVKGIGKKGAARMSLELTDKLKKSGVEVPQTVPLHGSAPPSPAAGIAGETVAALMVLGYSNAEALDAVRRAAIEESDTVESLLRRALSQMAMV
ncbi:MAG: Holliday junction branch migration protein RuvA [Clostridiaceae bacterium]|nr:Holliday junction branch migration protein RuvA [Clostridiaceae bacterium]